MKKSQAERDFQRTFRKGKWKRCGVCGLLITGKEWRISNAKFACTRCNNERV